ncbi:MAG: glycosyltransferase [Cyanobacteria bacterium P01_A01_bin.17]
MKKILFYCQYLAGMGHLVRSTEIIRSLVKDFQVCLVIGGEPITGFTVPVGAEVVYLPALREDAGELIAFGQSLESIKARRIDRLLSVCDQFQPDCVITECFPFSKYKMSFELVPLLEWAKAAQVKVVCSLRDLVMTQRMSEKGMIRKKARIHDQIRRYYDLVLYHCDRNLQPLDACFPTAADLDCEVFYTGYVAQVPSLMLQEKIQGPSIVASVGGGRDGYPLLKAVIEASPLLTDAIPHHIYAFAGPFMPVPQFEALQALAAAKSNLTLRRFTPNLISYLSQADLSISLGGYNTTMNVLRTHVRSLIVPSPSVDQAEQGPYRWLG